MIAPAEINNNEFKLLSELIYDQSGINLSEHKKPLLSSRLQKTLKRTGLNSFLEYYNFVIADKTGLELTNLINCISTNHTYFNREEKHFDYMSRVALPEIIQDMKNESTHDLRIWCAGCSTGEEAYMITMTLMEYFKNEYWVWDAGVLATDISGKVLDIAGEGAYYEENLKNLPPGYKKKYFSKTKDDRFKVIPKVKNEVTFRHFNLMRENFPFKKPFHIIFCRNVMIYFDNKTRSELINKFHRHMVPGGTLFIGHSETIGREQNLYKYIQPAVYKRI
jgi:chemotaxis protein methyltransferase CheR